MSLFDCITVFGAIATFLFGMSTMTDGLEKLSSGRLEAILEKSTNHVWKGVLLGALVTGLIQSSAATTVMCVGFVNAGIMKLRQAVGIIMGANIGTTVTAQLISLGGIPSDNILFMLLKPAVFGPILAGVGIILYMFIKRGHQQIIGQIMLGLGLLFIGMHTLEVAVSGLKDIPEFQNLLVSFSNPLLGILVGALVTALIQSSSASVGILQALSTTGAVTFNVAMPLIFGQNIGTCITAMLSAIGASRNAKRTAMIHLLFNVLGTLFFLILLYASNALFHFSFWETVLTRGSIANLHLAFNAGCTLLLLPLNKQLVTMVEHLVPGDAPTPEVNLLDERFLHSASVALEKSREAVIIMGNSARDNFRLAVELLDKFDEKKLDRLIETEVVIDRMEGMLDDYLLKLTGRALTSEENGKISELLHSLSDFERVGDYAVNLSESAVALHNRVIVFSPAAKAELAHLAGAVQEALDLTIDCFSSRSRELALKVEPLEEVVDLMKDVLKTRHIERLKSGECTIELGTQFLELLINLERISDHCSNVALLILRQTVANGADAADMVDTHAYLKRLHDGGSETYDQLYANYRAKYFTPISELELGAVEKSSANT